MAILTPSQLAAASDAVYFNNTSGSITPTTVRTLNNNWISSSILVSQTGSLNVLSASYAATASFLLGTIASASYAINAGTATIASTADTATFASTAGTANSAVTASYALNFNPSATASYANYAATASILLGSVQSASFAANAGLLGGLASSSFATTSSFNTFSSSIAGRVTTNESSISSLSSATSSYVTNSQTSSLNVLSASYAVSSSYAINAQNAYTSTTASYAANAELLDNLNSTAFVFTSSFNTFSGSVASQFANTPTLNGNNTFIGNNVFGNVTASNALITSASVLNLTVIYETASVIYSSGSNQFGDASNDVQTLWGTVDIKSGPVLVSGSMFVSGNINMLNGTDLVSHHLKAPSSNGVEIQNSSAGVVGLFGAGVSLGTTFYGQVNATAFAGSGSGILGVVSSSFAQTASLAATASFLNALSQSFTITGSVNGNSVSASIASSTSSLDFSRGNFFTSFVSASTFFNITNPKPGQTVNLLLTTVGVATASFSSNVKQVSGSTYTPTSGSSKNDVITFISWDGTSVYLANIKNLI